MGFQESPMWCNACGRHVLARRETASHLLHAILTLFTGFWAVVWLAAALTPGKWLCTLCGLPCTLPVGRGTPRLEDLPAAPPPRYTPSDAALRARNILLRVALASAILIFAAIVLSWPEIRAARERLEHTAAPRPRAETPATIAVPIAEKAEKATLFFFADRRPGMDGRRGYEVAAGQRVVIVEELLVGNMKMLKVETEAHERGWIEPDEHCLFVGLKE